MKIDLYFSFRSPYSYLILPRMLKLKSEYDIKINFKIVYPLAIRMPEFFKNKGLPYFIALSADVRRNAKKLGMPYTTKLTPDPIKQNLMTGTISKQQPYIFDICHLGQMAHIKGVGIEFAYEVSSLIFGGTKNWNHNDHLSKAAENVALDLHSLRASTKEQETEIIKQIEQNQVDQLNAGHHGVPLTVFEEKFFFGQDRFDDVVKLLKENGLQQKIK